MTAVALGSACSDALVEPDLTSDGLTSGSSALVMDATWDYMGRSRAPFPNGPEAIAAAQAALYGRAVARFITPFVGDGAGGWISTDDKGWCSSFLINRDVLVTARHCSVGPDMVPGQTERVAVFGEYFTHVLGSTIGFGELREPLGVEDARAQLIALGADAPDVEALEDDALTHWTCTFDTHEDPVLQDLGLTTVYLATDISYWRCDSKTLAGIEVYPSDLWSVYQVQSLADLDPSGKTEAYSVSSNFPKEGEVTGLLLSNGGSIHGDALRECVYIDYNNNRSTYGGGAVEVGDLTASTCMWHDLDIAPGSSGGPLLSEFHAVLGVHNGSYAPLADWEAARTGDRAAASIPYTEDTVTLGTCDLDGMAAEGAPNLSSAYCAEGATYGDGTFFVYPRNGSIHVNTSSGMGRIGEIYAGDERKPNSDPYRPDPDFPAGAEGGDPNAGEYWMTCPPQFYVTGILASEVTDTVSVGNLAAVCEPAIKDASSHSLFEAVVIGGGANDVERSTANGQRYIHYRNYAVQLKNKHTVAQHEMFCRPGEYLAEIPAERSGDGGVLSIDGVDCVPFGATEITRRGFALGAAMGGGPPVMCTTAGFIPYGIRLKRVGANLRAEFICGEPT